ncbi:OLC1v1021706C1 [Oldenlandia corymbosa var. corymbosa]|uniref:OLC1v1021706C1 n=1 Tax=Oldenlandia corymbosa var. corymbosa TaxID=529605 RepID=A0AAV1BYQ5_OLDCO|nr:OLC1v1021706C1 [Oldenlandia corymbosa var. corymbosa]
MASPTTFLFPFKVALIATGAISIALAVKFSVPLIIGFCLYDVPILWTSFQAWLKPPYLYFIINGIIIIIAATSKFSNQIHHPQVNIPATGQPPVQYITIRAPPPSDVVASVVLTSEAAPAPAPAAVEVGQVYDYVAEEDESEEAKVVELKPVVVNGIKQLGWERVDWEDGDNDDNVANCGAWIVPKADIVPTPEINFEDVTPLEFVSPPVKEKPLVLSSFSHIPKPTITNPPEGGRAVRVVGRRRKQQQQQAEEHDTMENTWKMITEGRRVLPVPVKRQLTKSDTWDGNHGGGVVVNSLDLDLLDLAPPPRQVPKSATFRDRTNYYDSLTAPPPPPAGKIRKEPSLTPEEVNRRAEEFIRKFNEEMRLQRQESLNKYMEMINRGT